MNDLKIQNYFISLRRRPSFFYREKYFKMNMNYEWGRVLDECRYM